MTRPCLWAIGLGLLPTRFLLLIRITIRFGIPNASSWQLSISPSFMRERRAVEFVFVQAPLRHQGVHQCAKTLVVVSLQEVDHLVDENVRQARGGLLDQFEIQPNAPGTRVAGPPASLHLFDPHIIDDDADLWLPLGDERGQFSAELVAVPAMQYGLAHRSVTARAHA